MLNFKRLVLAKTSALTAMSCKYVPARFDSAWETPYCLAYILGPCGGGCSKIKIFPSFS